MFVRSIRSFLRTRSFVQFVRFARLSINSITAPSPCTSSCTLGTINRLSFNRLKFYRLIERRMQRLEHKYKSTQHHLKLYTHTHTHTCTRIRHTRTGTPFMFTVQGFNFTVNIKSKNTANKKKQQRSNTLPAKVLDTQSQQYLHTERNPIYTQFSYRFL